MGSRRKISNYILVVLSAAIFSISAGESYALAHDADTTGQNAGYTLDVEEEQTEDVKVGGGYAATGQIDSVGYAARIYDAMSGMPTSDANFILGSSDGYVWIGSYSGILRYDGISFEKIDYSEGLTSARGLFEDSLGRIWVGTNDNGVVVINGEDATWITYKDGLPSSSIRVFAEDLEGNVYIGTTEGLCYADTELKIHVINDSRINQERILSLSSDAFGAVYGHTRNGKIFVVKDKLVQHCYATEEIGLKKKITNILADKSYSGYVYIGTEGSEVYYGRFGNQVHNMKRISVAPLKGIHWINYDCGRVWVSSISQVGYIDEYYNFCLLKDIPMTSGIEMVTSDYQGNLWVASSTQGVMKIVTSHFLDLSQKTSLPQELANTTCLVGEKLYVGTDTGLRILDKNNRLLENELTKYIGSARVRCLMRDDENNLWIATYTGDHGLVCYSESGEITSFTTEKGLPGNEIRCVVKASGGKILVGTNNGIAVIKDGKVERVIDASSGIKNTVILTLVEGGNGSIIAGTDGGGIYIISDDSIRRIGRDESLSSDVILRIKRDEKRNLYWVITSNSIEYFKNGILTQVTSFPYNNNYDLFFDKNDNAWIISSYGLYMVGAEELLKNDVTDYKLYTLENGLSGAPTANLYNELDDEGNLYIAGRNGVCKVNIDHFYDDKMLVKAMVKSVYIGDTKILPDEQGRYLLPSLEDRVRITIAVPDYTLTDPPVRVYLEGDNEKAAIIPRSDIKTLEYTGMNPGNYTLHIEVLDTTKKNVFLEETFYITKKFKISELLFVRVIFIAMIALMAGVFVWRFLKNTVIRKQYEEIKQARDDAERANLAKTRFLANISHEIRTPINTIMGMDEMIMREDATNVPRGYFLSMMNYAFDIRNASDTLLGLINDLLDISKIESGKMHLVEQEYDVQDLLRSIVSMIRVKCTEKELMFDVVVDEIMPKKLYGDAGKIKQIVLNLLTNAVKYTEKGGVVLSVSLDERNNDEANISFSVKDTGIGVKQEDKDRLFTAYERLDEQKNSGIQGTGLGLEISRRFALLMGGSLVCESVYGEGSEFILSLKQKIMDASALGAFVEHDESTPKGPYIPQFVAPDADVLVVDDNPMNLNVIKGLLKATKIFVTTANSGEDCLEKMKTTRFNVVLLDHMMPGMDGIETVGEIRKTDSDIPVYALTANTTVGEDFYKSKGFTGYLSKPIDSLALEKAIMKHLPEEIMFKPQKEDAVEEITSIPEDFKWIYEVDGIDVEEGIKNSGGISAFMFSVKLFLDTIDGNEQVIRQAYESDNIRLYTIKVHALKSSARIIGATKLSELAKDLEDAGNKEDRDFITMHNDELLTEYTGYRQKLSALLENEEENEAEGKEAISEEELKDAWEALKEVIPQMDYDAVEMILGQLKEYRLPKESKEKVSELEKMLKLFDWDGMEELLDK